MFKKYYLEIKNRLSLILITWILTCITCFFYKETLLFLIIKPFMKVYPQAFSYFISTNLTEVFSSYILISYFIGTQLTFFYLLYHLVTFLTPALYKYEYKNLRNLIFLSFIFWLFNIGIFTQYILPHSLKFFLSFQETIENQAIKIYFEAKITEYLDFYINLFYLSNLNSQIFFVIVIIINYLKEKLKVIKIYRKFVYFIYFIIATLITPPDIGSQLISGFSFILITEFTLLIIIFKSYLIR